jgi:hypothetical protein
MTVASAADRMQSARAQLNRVLQSEAFRNSESLRHLLAYVAEKSLADPPEELKEYTIGIEACGKPPSYDPQKDASVRVQMGRLRQKLDEYYRAEGARDPIVLDLPKGRFAIVFHARAPEKPSGRRSAAELLAAGFRRLRAVRLASVVLLILLMAALAWAAWLTSRLRAYEAELAVSDQARTIRMASPLWGPFLSHSVPSVAVFGSPPVFASLKYGLFVRFYNPADPDDPRSSPDFSGVEASVGPLAGPRYDYASMGDAIAVQRLTSFFGSAGIALAALPAHLANWDTIKNRNVILIGAWRMHPLLRKLPVSQDFELGADEQIHNRNVQSGEQRVYTTPSHRNAMTYAMVGAFPGLKPGREVLVITAHSSPGASGAADFITSPESLRIVEDRIALSSSGPRKYFQMLLRIYVDSDVPVKAEYVTHHLIPRQ